MIVFVNNGMIIGAFKSETNDLTVYYLENNKKTFYKYLQECQDNLEKITVDHMIV